MLDVENSETSKNENQQIASEGSANTIINSYTDSDTDKQTKDSHTGLDVEDLYVNMIFPS